MFGKEATWRASHLNEQIVCRVVVGSIIVALGVGVLLLVRRATGALTAPLPPAMLVATALVLLAWALAVQTFTDGRTNPLMTWLPTVVLALFAVGCSYPGGRFIDWLVWLPVIVANSAAPRWVTRRTIPATRSSLVINRNLSSERVLQQFIRSRTVEGQDIIQGTLTAEFSPKERNVSLHVGFCPPFDQLPQVEAEAVDGPNCEIKIAQILHQGTRIEVRLDTIFDAPQRVTIEFQASAAAPPPAPPNPPLAV